MQKGVQSAVFRIELLEKNLRSGHFRETPRGSEYRSGSEPVRNAEFHVGRRDGLVGSREVRRIGGVVVMIVLE
jgi:hypothetical protein